MPPSTRQEELVESVKLYNPRPVLLHAYAGPFVVLYAVWIFIWTSWTGQIVPLEDALSSNDTVFTQSTTAGSPTENGTLLEESLSQNESTVDNFVEAGFIGLAIIGVLQTLVYLFCHWSVHVRAYLTCTKVKSQDPLQASLAKVVPTPSNGSPELVRLVRSKGEAGERKVISFMFQESKYEYDYESNCFEAIEYPTRLQLKTYLHHKGYQDEEETNLATRKYGPNKTNMKIPSFKDFFIERATAPFFVFQVFCVLLWCLDEYWMYSVFTLFMLIVFEATLVQQQLRSMKEIRNMGNKAYKISVYRNRKWRPMSSSELLPGDIVSVTPGKGAGTGQDKEEDQEELIPCDMLLLRGSCVVDESMLTGESVPQMKEPIESEFNEDGTSGDLRSLEIETDGKLRILFGGTKIVQHTPPSKSTTALKSPDNGCVCYVLQTGFSTSQGKLLRTIMYGVRRVTANNLETFAFILFLLIFAIAASAYVWVKGTEDPERNRYKLFLECTLILTSVVPPELPIELSLAVNSSVLSLTRLGVFCTEPFRIPFAGKVEICCFDKTGTLTSDNLVIEGVVTRDGGSEPLPVRDLNAETIQTLATCHALVTLDDGTTVGDPLEKATLQWIDFDLNKDVVVPKKSSVHPNLRGVKIFHRFHFSSSLKRMSVVAGVADGLQTNYFATAKGAPEIMKFMFANLPKNYEETYLSYTRRGARVLALGIKQLGVLSHQDVRQLGREDIESELKFLGFIVVSCPLKADSKKVIHEIMNSSHKAIMITGDNALTACYVAQQLKMAHHPHMLIFTPETMTWESIDGEIVLPFVGTLKQDLVSKYDLCLTGDGLSRIMTYKEKDLIGHLSRLLPFIVVFARMAPKQKEWIINGIKNRGYCTLMCGDGTNDVGALKHAHVGVAILSHCPEWVEKKQEILAQIKQKEKELKAAGNDRDASNGAVQVTNKPPKTGGAVSRPGRSGPGARRPAGPTTQAMEKTLNQMLKDIEEQEKAQIVKLGDASIAAPFSSKLSSIECICHVIKQGRCTLVTTLQMFKILALNALILAYSQSVLYLDGVKLSDSQATFHGLLLAACFFFISHSKPMKTLSKKRPLPNIFNAYTLLTVFLQFALHFSVMVFCVRQALTFAPEDRPPKVDLDKKFEPNLLNSTVYIISLALQVTTFLINYRGHPFMVSITENKPFFYSIVVAGCAVVGLVTRAIPDFNEQFEIVPIPEELQKSILSLLALDVVGSFIVDRVCMWLFGEGRLRIK